MLHSMTGYGKVETQYNNKPIEIEIKSINSKQCDVNVRTSSPYREKEIEIRKLIQTHLLKGKIDVYIHVENDSEKSNFSINLPLAKQYVEQLKMLSDITGEKENNYLSILMNLPDVLTNETPVLEDEEWEVIRQGIEDCTKKVIDFRKTEGAVLEKDFLTHIHLIMDYLNEIPAYEAERIQNMREKIYKNIASLNVEAVDENRFEQEMIYYMEKLDITEEKVRLKNHCDYFIETLNTNTSNGKKLNFISQEIGREINTIGSKANHYNIQHLVVKMKDELEKIKEQLSNIL